MAGIKIIDLPAIGIAQGTDVFPVSQSGVTYKESNTQVFTYFKTIGEALTRISDTNITLTLGGSPATALLNATSITAGWNGQLSVPRGGTGASSFTAYSVICGGTGATSPLQSVVGLGNAGEQLTSNGAGALPTWQTGTTVTPSALTRTDDTNITVTLGGTPSTALLQAVSLTMGWAGTLSGTRGGTGVNNGASTITLGGSLTTSGAFASTFTMTGITGVTFPTSGTLATTGQLPTPAALTAVDDTNITITLGGTPATALLQATSLTMGWTGILSGVRGGTGVNNGGKTLTLADNLATIGGFASNFTMTGITNVTFPTSGTLATTTQLPTPAALTKTDDTNVTLALGGTPTTALLQATSLTLGWTGQLSLARGGSGANLTASNGGIIYSTASAMAILAGTSTASQLLLSGASTTPAWSTSTYPATNAVNTLLYASSANVMAALATANSSVLITSAGGVPSLSTTLPGSLTIPTPTISGNLTYTANTAGQVGIVSGAVKTSGVVGEVLLSLITTPVSMTTNTATNIATLSLTAGNWLVSGELWASAGAATLLTNFVIQITTASATLNGTPSTSLSRSQVSFPAPAASAQIPILCTMPAVINITTTTTVYLVGFSQYTGDAVSGSGKILAYRYS